MSKPSRIVTIKFTSQTHKIAAAAAAAAAPSGRPSTAPTPTHHHLPDLAPAPGPPPQKPVKAPKVPKAPKEKAPPKEPKASKKSKQKEPTGPITPVPIAAAPAPPPPREPAPYIKKEEDEDESGSKASVAQAPAPVNPPKIKLSFSNLPKPSKPSAPPTPKTPVIRITNNASRPHRNAAKRVLPLGLGYDSEASDREEDPAIEEQFILRMQPGEDCDYLREVIEKRELDKDKDVWMKFKDNRRAVVFVRGHLYAATLVDLPCILESSKTLDKKNIFKTADICQMLLVGDRIIHEDQVFSIPTPPSLLTYPHGITPPMHWARKRRFRKRISNRTIEAVEAEVERLLAADNDAVSANYELIDQNELTRQNSVVAGGEDEDAWAEEDYADEDAEGEDEEMYEGDDYEEAVHEEEEMDEDAFMTQLESTMMNVDDREEGGGDEGANANGSVNGGVATSLTTPTTATPAGGKSGESSDEDEDDEEDYGDDGGDMDEDAHEAAQNLQQVREEIADLEATIQSKSKELESATNTLMKQRIKTQLGGLKAELEIKKAELEGAAGSKS